MAVVDGGFADEAVEFVVGEFDAAVSVGGFGQVAGNGVVFETGAADAFVFALSVFVGHFAALFFDQLAEDVAFEMVDVPSLGTVFQTTFIGTLAVFGLLDQLSGGVVVVAGGMAQRIGNGFEIAVFGITEAGGFAGTVGKADEPVEGVVV